MAGEELKRPQGKKGREEGPGKQERREQQDRQNKTASKDLNHDIAASQLALSVSKMCAICSNTTGLNDVKYQCGSA